MMGRVDDQHDGIVNGFADQPDIGCRYHADLASGVVRLELEASPQLIRPLCHERRRNKDDHTMIFGLVEYILSDQNARLNRLSKTDLVSQKIPLHRILQDPLYDLYLVGLKLDAGREQCRHPKARTTLRRKGACERASRVSD